MKLEENSRTRSRLFHTLPETNAPIAAPPPQPQRSRGCSHRLRPTRPTRGCRCPGRGSLPTPASALPSPVPQAAAVAGGPRALTGLRQRERTGARGPQRQRGLRAAILGARPGRACAITSQRRSARGRWPRQWEAAALPLPPAQCPLRQRLLSRAAVPWGRTNRNAKGEDCEPQRPIEI